jgi:hypothetical protein
MTGRTRSTRDIDLVKVAYAHDEIEAEFLQGLLREADVVSVVRRAPGFDVPEFLAGGPRHLLVAASDVPVAHDVLREVTQVSPRSVAVRCRPAVAGARRAADPRGTRRARRLPGHRRVRLSRRPSLPR